MDIEEILKNFNKVFDDLRIPISVRVWQEHPEGEKPYWCEGYQIGDSKSNTPTGRNVVIYTGREGFLNFRKQGIPMKYTLNGVPIEEKEIFEILGIE